MKHQYHILTIGPGVHNLSAPMPLKMAEDLLSSQECLKLQEGFFRYVVVKEVSKK